MAIGTVKEIEDGRVSVSTWCPFCFKENPAITATWEEWELYLGGTLSALELTQDKDAAEYLITGCCSSCWDSMFSEKDEDDREPVHVENLMNDIEGFEC